MPLKNQIDYLSDLSDFFNLFCVVKEKSEQTICPDFLFMILLYLLSSSCNLNFHSLFTLPYLILYANFHNRILLIPLLAFNTQMAGLQKNYFNSILFLIETGNSLLT